MELTVALDGEKKRDLRFFAGDDMSLTIVVYAHDGDVSPIAVTNVRFAAADGSLPMGSEFVVPSNFFGRVPYRIVGEVADITTTLAYGVMQTEGGWPSLFCWCAGPWPYGVVGKAENITVLDAHQNFNAPGNVESALEELGDFKKVAGDIGASVEIAVNAAAAAEESAEEAAEAAAEAVGVLAVVVKNELVPSRVAHLEQFITGFSGRGMLTAETINLVTEQAIVGPAAAGTDTVGATDATNFLVGARVSIKHINGRYANYFVAAKAANVLTLRPNLRYAVNSTCRIERTWFNRAHPGKFYMRELAQRIAYSTELDAAAPTGGRILFTDNNDPTTAEDKLVVLGGAVVNYFAASSIGSSGDETTPVRFPLGNTAYVTSLSVNAGVETALYSVPLDGDYIAKFVFSAAVATPSFLVQVLDGSGIANNEVIATYAIPASPDNVVPRVHTIPFTTRATKYLKVRVTCTAAPSGGFSFDQVDVFRSGGETGLIATKRTGAAVIVGLGDSWVAGDLVNTPEREPITQQLALELPGVTIINAGVGGNKIWEEVARFDTDVAPYRPDYVFVNTGTNECYNPASGTFYPNSVDYFLFQYRLLIDKILAIGARPIIIGVPALAQTDGAFSAWALNDRARTYGKYFTEWLAVRPLALGAKSGLESYRTDAVLTTGATPSVASMRRVDLTYAGATSITNLLGGVDGQIVTLTAKNGNVTLQPGILQLAGGVAVNLPTNSTITLQKLDPSVTTAWVELGRSITAASSSQEVTFTDADGATPSVAALALSAFVNLTYASATNITNFPGGVKNQQIQIRATTGNVTLPNGAFFRLTGSTNVTLTTNSVITLVKVDPALSGAWNEVSRSIK